MDSLEDETTLVTPELDDVPEDDEAEPADAGCVDDLPLDKQ